MAKRAEIAGQRFGRLVALEYDHSNERGRAIWKCQCDCGKTHYCKAKDLLNGNTVSCGCAKVDRARMMKYKDGRCSEKLYQTWLGMFDRCSDPKEKYYCAKGVRVCDEWKDYPTFRKWAYENGYDPKLSRWECSIDRIDSNGNYEPSNCRWADFKTQLANRNITPSTYNRSRDKYGKFTKNATNAGKNNESSKTI